jgi:hypothetical protein
MINILFGRFQYYSSGCIRVSFVLGQYWRAS